MLRDSKNLDSTVGRGIVSVAALAGAVTLTMAVAGSAHASPTALYKLDEPANSTGPVTDSADGHDGTVLGSPTRGEPGVFNTAYRFANSSGDGVNLGSNSAVQPTGDFTATFWFNADSIGKYDRFIGSIDTGNGYRLFLGGGTEVTLVTKHPGNDPNVNSHVVPDLGTWYFTAVRYDTDGDARGTVLADMSGNASAMNIGNASTSGTAANGPITYTSGAETWLARNPEKDNNTFNGRMDDVAFFDNVLTNQQLADIRNNGAGFVVPEPASLALLGLGGLSMLGRRRRRRA